MVPDALVSLIPGIQDVRTALVATTELLTDVDAIAPGVHMRQWIASLRKVERAQAVWKGTTFVEGLGQLMSQFAGRTVTGTQRTERNSFAIEFDGEACALLAWRSERVERKSRYWPQAQAAGYAAFLSREQFAIPFVCTSTADVSVGVLVKSGQLRFPGGRNYLAFEVLEPTLWATCQQNGVKLIEAIVALIDKCRSMQQEHARALTQLHIGVPDPLAGGACALRLDIVRIDGAVLKASTHNAEQSYAIKCCLGDVTDAAMDKMVAVGNVFSPSLQWCKWPPQKAKVLVSLWKDGAQIITAVHVDKLIDALVAAWKQDYFHGDLRPPPWGGNVIFAPNEEAHILDFEMSAKGSDRRRLPENLNRAIFNEYLVEPIEVDQVLGLWFDVRCMAAWLCSTFLPALKNPAGRAQVAEALHECVCGNAESWTALRGQMESSIPWLPQQSRPPHFRDVYLMGWEGE